VDFKHKRRGVSLVEVIVVALVLAVLTVVLLPFYLQQVDKARGAAAKSGVRSIQIAVLAYSLDGHGAFPRPDTVGPAGLSEYADSWPSNAWTGKPMADSGRYLKGDFHYEAWTSDGEGDSIASTGALTAPALDNFGLIGYLADPGLPFVARPLGHPRRAAASKA
jgi:type II secretory pathway pseudopilin PulG